MQKYKYGQNISRTYFSSKFKEIHHVICASLPATEPLHHKPPLFLSEVSSCLCGLLVSTKNIILVIDPILDKRIIPE
jgi:hypothetical protein